MSDMSRDLHAYLKAARTVRHSGDVSTGAAMLFQDIAELSVERGECWATNQHFADSFGVTKRTIRNWMGELTENGYVRRTPAKNRLQITEKPFRKDSSSPRKISSETPNAASRGRKDFSGEGGKDFSGTKDIYTPERGESKSAREKNPGSEYDTSSETVETVPEAGPAADALPEDPVAIYEAECDRRPSIFEQEQIRHLVGATAEERGLWQSICRTWRETPGWNHRQVVKMLKSDYVKQSKDLKPSRPHRDQSEYTAVLQEISGGAHVSHRAA